MQIGNNIAHSNYRTSHNGYRETRNSNVCDRDSFHDAIQNYADANKLTAQKLKEETDWRNMSDDEWDKLLEGIDEYIDDYVERLQQLKEMQDEAAQEAAMEADSERRTIAASSAALNVVANGFVSGSTSIEDAEAVPALDGADHEKNWTKKLSTDDQTILRTAQVAQEMEKMAMSKLQEIQQKDSTVVGVSHTENITACASVEDDDKDQLWRSL